MRIGIKKGNDKDIVAKMPKNYPADRVYLDGDTTKNVQDAIDKKQLSFSPVSGVTVYQNTLIQMNGIVFGDIDISASSDWTVGTWTNVGEIQNYSNSDILMAMGWDSQNGDYFGLIMINYNGVVRVYPKKSTSYCKGRF